jgi:DNA-binding IclR family transcriptional regulator
VCARYRSKNAYSINAVANTLEFIEALCDEDASEGIRMSRLGARLGLAKSNVYRLLMTFEEWGFVEREPASGRFRLGLSAYEMGQKVLLRMSLRQKVRPVMEELARESNESAYLAVRREKEYLLLDMAECSQRVQAVSLLGRKFPIGVGAPGQLFANYEAGSDPGELYPDPELLLRRQGYSIDHEGFGAGLVGVAVPLQRSDGSLLGCLCLVGPDFRLSNDRVERDILPALREAGDAISRKFGYLRRALGKVRL